MTTILELDSNQVLGVVDDRNRKGVGGLALRPPADPAPSVQAESDRPVGRVPKGAADVAYPRRCRDRPLLSALPGQPGPDRGPAEPVPRG